MEITIEDLKWALQNSWSAETSNDPRGWSLKNPARGQCAVTALIVQDYFGGHLIRCKVDNNTHYFNILPDNSEIDLTLNQFSHQDLEKIKKSHSSRETKSRRHVLSYPDTVKRYNLLKKNVENFIKLERYKKIFKKEPENKETKKIFLICPVRDAKNKITERVRGYVQKLESKGCQVHWPARDTNQNDPNGIRICMDNGMAIREADEVHIFWMWKEKKWWQKPFWWIKEKKSTGSLFDFGMSFMLFLLRDKKIILANPDEIKPTKKKSFTNVLLSLHQINTPE